MSICRTIQVISNHHIKTLPRFRIMLFMQHTRITSDRDAIKSDGKVIAINYIVVYSANPFKHTNNINGRN